MTASLPFGIKVPEQYKIESTISAYQPWKSIPFYLSGISIRNGPDKIVGASGSTNSNTLELASYELIERISIYEATTQGEKSDWPAFDRQGNTIGEIRHSSVFPVSDDPSNWCFIRSNGVAVHSNLLDAIDRAESELIERDAFFLAWYGFTRPKEIGVNFETPAQIDGKSYLFRFFELPCRFGSRRNTSLCLAIPAQSDDLMVLGLGCARTQENASTKAFNETLQRLGFLWSLSSSSDKKKFSPSADYHQNFYLNRNNYNVLINWLEKSHSRFLIGKIPRVSEYDLESTIFAIVTPEWGREHFSVVKALNRVTIPATFGYCTKFVPRHFPERLLIHPLA